MGVDHTMRTCPSCEGRKEGLGFVSRRDSGCGLEAIPCMLCSGAGEVTVARADAHARGHRIYDARVELGMSLREFAAVLELKPVDVSSIERGKAPETWLQGAEVAVGLRAEVTCQL